MIKEYQNQYNPDVVSPPGETLAELLDDHYMTQAELATRMGRPKKTINEIIKGKTAITPETALQLERVLGPPAQFWNNREQQYQQYLARVAERKQLAPYVDWLKTFPVKEMVKRGWMAAYDDKLDQLYALLSYFGVASPTEWKSLCAGTSFRKTEAFDSTPEALSVWLRRGVIEAQQILCQPYNAKTFRENLAQIRHLTCEPPKIFVPKLVALCAQAGVAVVFVPQLSKSKVSGATRWLTSDKALIQLSLRYKTDDHLWFSFFHEAGHILKHGKSQLFLDFKEPVSDTEQEREANEFATEFLIPASEMARFKATLHPKLHPSKKAIRLFAQRLGIAPGIVVGRLQYDEIMPFTHCNGLKQKLTWKK